MRPWILAEANYGFVKENRYEVVVLPLGATEPHNLHLPYGTDVFEGTHVGEQICEEAWKRGAKVALLPTIPYGTETNLNRFPLAINIQPTTLFRVITDIVHSVANSGVKKIVLVNSHGGNDMKALLRELYGSTPAHVFLTNWYTVASDVYSQIFEHKDDHAGELETSFGLAHFPTLVAKQSNGKLAADDGKMASTRFEAVNRGWVNITRPWHLLTTNSGAGYPHAASAEKAEKLLNVVVDRLATFLTELSAAQLDEKFPF